MSLSPRAFVGRIDAGLRGSLTRDSSEYRRLLAADNESQHGSRLRATLWMAKKLNQPWGLLFVGVLLILAVVVLVFLIFHQ
jgi:hypothetical protein